jgi:hypothetical protein
MIEQRRDDRVTDPAVDAAWRRAAQEQPPAEVDAAILAAAAGVIGLSLLLVQMLPRDRLAPPAATQDAPRAPAAEPAGITAPVPAAGDAASVMSAERESAAGAAPRAAMESAPRQSVTAIPESQAAWASRIVVLHDAGDLAAAAAELRAFRAAYPDADDYLPEAVRAWARSVSQDGTR